MSEALNPISSESGLELKSQNLCCTRESKAHRNRTTRVIHPGAEAQQDAAQKELVKLAVLPSRGAMPERDVRTVFCNTPLCVW